MSSFHNSYIWQKARDVIMKRYNGLCADPFGLHTNKGMLARNIIIADVVHHIVPVEADLTKALSLNNLVPLCDKCHELAHKLLSTKKGRIAYRNAFKLPAHILLYTEDKTPEEQPFFTKKQCFKKGDKVFCVRCGRLRDHPCPTCEIGRG